MFMFVCKILPKLDIEIISKPFFSVSVKLIIILLDKRSPVWSPSLGFRIWIADKTKNLLITKKIVREIYSSAMPHGFYDPISGFSSFQEGLKII
ncbi:hypothetical protein BpHYR1_001960 [Brachionus plicatilis]|uniref:Uncharacterized protein n=1 Tax=Brachionus plicatilis TaxID=10195 RepID=A0A3M7RU32_BRAPC|nr:hypothetical protein BpHYR1_001960 [Brachionus plicatilis]